MSIKKYLQDALFVCFNSVYTKLGFKQINMENVWKLRSKSEISRCLCCLTVSVNFSIP